MHCPYCRNTDTRVVDSRVADDGGAIRRRRTCPACEKRFSTVEQMQLVVVNRLPHSLQERRRRIAPPSSATRLSRTRVSVLRQYGQCMSAAPFPVSIVWLSPLLQHPAPTVSARPDSPLPAVGCGRICG